MTHTNGTNGTKAPTNGTPSNIDVSIALKANDAAAVPDLIQEISSPGKNFNSDDDQATIKLAMKARALWKSLETPRDTMIRHLWAEVSADYPTIQSQCRLMEHLTMADFPLAVLTS